jgi:hypothetical protein
MRSKPEYPLESFEKFPQLGEPWIFGKMLRMAPTQALEYTVSRDCKEPPYLMYELPYPLIRRELLKQIMEAGADNIEVFDAVLHHPAVGVMRHEYVAFNILGMVATSDIAARVMENYSDWEFETDEIAGIVLDCSVIPEGIMLARIADRMGRILVNNRLRDQIDPGPETGLVFFDLS